MLIREITADKWSNLLKEASPPIVRDNYIKKYLAIKMPEDAKDLSDCSIEAITADQLQNKKYTKLNLREITYLSKSIINKEVDATRKPIDAEEEIVIGQALTRLSKVKTQRLNEARLKRGILRAISYLLFATIIGIGFGCWIKDNLDAPEKELEIAKNFAKELETRGLSRQEEPIQKEIRSDADYIEKVKINIENQNTVGQDLVLSYMQQTFSRRMHESDQEAIGKFFLDNSRSILGIHIEDSLRKKSYDAEGHGTTEKAEEYCKTQIEKFKEIVQLNEKDKKWLNLLLIIYGQTTSSCLLDKLKYGCKTFSLKSTTSETYELYSPKTQIDVNIVRSEELETSISSLQVTARAESLLYHTLDNEQGPEDAFNQTNVLGKAQSILKFTITMNSKNEPEFEITEYRHEMI